MPTNASGGDDGHPPGEMQGVDGVRIRRVHGYWSALRGARPFPAWTEFNLMDIYETAPYLAVLDVEGATDAPQFRYRFCGTMLVEMRDRLMTPDPTGRRAHEIDWPFDAARLLAAFATVVQSGQPIYLPPGFLAESGYRRLARGLFPLGVLDARVEQVIVCVDPLPPDKP